MRKAALILGVVALAILAFFLLRLEGGSPTAAAAPLAIEPSVEESPPAEVLPIVAPRDEARTAAAEPVAAEPEVQRPSADASVKPEGGSLPLAGTIVVVDERGAEHRAEDGSFAFVLWNGQRGTWHEVKVEDGRWRTEIPRVPAVEYLGLANLRLGERTSVSGPAFEGRFAWPTDNWLDLTARWPNVSLLHVRDRESGRELAPVFVVDSGSWPQSEFAHPGPDGASAKELGPSPVQLPSPPSNAGIVGTRAVHVRSPGYGWARIEIDEAKGGERILLLDPAGEIEIVPVGTAFDPGTKLRVVGSEFTPVFEVPLRSAGPVVVDSLRAGNYRVKAEIGDYWSEPLVLGEATVEVVAGARARVTLVLKDPGARKAVPLAGVLELPAEWEVGSFRLDFDLLDTPLGGGDGRFAIESFEMNSEGSPSSTWRWSRPEVQPGRYDVRLRKVAFQAVLTVGDAGLREARLVVPPPCVVLVQCVDEDTGLDVTDQQVTWHGAFPEGAHSWSTEIAKWDETLRRWRFRAPQGKIQVVTHEGAYARAMQEILAVPGTNDALLRLGRPTGLRVILRDGQTDIPWSSSGDVYPALESAEGQESYSSWSTGGGKITLHKREPGLYTLKLPEIPGFEPVPEVQVRLEKGQVKEHVVELVRKR